MTKLKPCPFCGKTNISVEETQRNINEYYGCGLPDTFWVYCKTCYSCSGARETKEAAISTWNNRVKEIPNETDSKVR